MPGAARPATAASAGRTDAGGTGDAAARSASGADRRASGPSMHLAATRIRSAYSAGVRQHADAWAAESAPVSRYEWRAGSGGRLASTEFADTAESLSGRLAVGRRHPKAPSQGRAHLSAQRLLGDSPKPRQSTVMDAKERALGGRIAAHQDGGWRRGMSPNGAGGARRGWTPAAEFRRTRAGRS